MPRKKQSASKDAAFENLLNAPSTGNGWDQVAGDAGEPELDESPLASGFKDDGDVSGPSEQAARRRRSKATTRGGAQTLQDEQTPDESDSQGVRDRPNRPTSRSGPRARTRKPEAERAHSSRAIASMPLLPLRDMVIFPHMVTSLFVGRAKSIKAIESALSGDRVVFAVAQRDPEVEDVRPSDLYEMGVELVIGRSLKMPDGTISLLVQGQRRAKVRRYLRTQPFLKVEVEAFEDPVEKTPDTEALMRAVLALFEKVVKLSRHLSEESYVAAMNVDEPGWLADLIASSLSLDLESRQQLLETVDPVERLRVLSLMLAKELDVLDLENRIQSRVQSEVDRSQREFYLREQMKAIAHELGDYDPTIREANDLRARIEASGMPDEVRAKALEELERMQAMPVGMPEVGVIRTYIDWLIALPWTQQTPDHLDIKAAARVLDANHYGLSRVKERILEYMAVRKLAQGKMRSPILCFVGPPGVGKTSLGRSIAEALGRRFVRVSLGGIRDEAEIRGHRRTYIGALPGRIIQTMKVAGTINPVFMMDEIDKLGMDFRGDPAAALLEVLDPEQNYAFSDHYLDVPYNLSKVMFILTANLLDPIPPALLDRMEVIELPGYIEDEKYHIARQFLVPRQIEEHGLTPAHIHFKDGAIRRLIREYTHEAGVRNLEREIGAICRKVARRVAEVMPETEDLQPAGRQPGTNGTEEPVPTASGASSDGASSGEQSAKPLAGYTEALEREAVVARSASVDAGDDQEGPSDMAPVTPQVGQETAGPAANGDGKAGAGGGKPIRPRIIHEKNLEQYLGPPRYSYGMAEEQDEVGVATGVYWTPMGGDIISVEVTVMEGKGNLLLTGQLGDVMKESAQAALSYARTRARQLGIDPARFEKTDIHIHVPAGAIPKDGPSAGVTMATALVSALTGRRVRRDVAMTGEITLRGKVLPIGGLKEKVLAAHRAGISTFILPRENEKDLVEIPQKVRRQLQLHPVDDLDTVLRIALRPAPNVSEPLPEPDTAPAGRMAAVRGHRAVTGVHPG
jgi:ATP-dependent Lon protease